MYLPCTSSLVIILLTFTATGLFLLPYEVRLMIWEYTWPPPRLIDLAIKDPLAFPDQHIWPPELGSLQFYPDPIHISEGLVRYGFGGSFDRNPIALNLCRESREHTLMQYKIVENTQTGPEKGSFYADPSRDALLVRFSESTSYYDVMGNMIDCYGERLSLIQTLVLMPVIYISSYIEVKRAISRLQGLKTILWLLVEEPTPGSVENHTVQGHHGIDEDIDNVLTAVSTRYAVADEVRLLLAGVTRSKPGVEHIWCLDGNGKIY
jgi:hypothetical protein